MAYTADHAGAYADVLAAGAAVTFTRYAPGTHNATTDTFSASTTTTVSGVAIETKGMPRKYDAEALTETEGKTMLFVPATYGALPALGSAVTWGGKDWTVRRTEDLSPDGTAILGYIEVTR